MIKMVQRIKVERIKVEWTKVEFPIDQITYRLNLELSPEGCIPDRPPEGEGLSATIWGDASVIRSLSNLM